MKILAFCLLPFASASAFCLCALAGPAPAETPAGKFNRCISQSPTDDVSAECVAMRTSYLAQIEGCMAAIRMPAADPSIRAPSTSSHAYRARYLICARTVKARHGPFGHSAASPALTDLGVCLTMTESPDSL